jgi:hypothetical protein
VVIVGICYKAYLGEPAQSTAEPANLANASITAYFLVAAALPFYLRRRAQLTPAAIALAIAAALAMLLAMAGTLYPIPAAPYNVLHTSTWPISWPASPGPTSPPAALATNSGRHSGAARMTTSKLDSYGKREFARSPHPKWTALARWNPQTVRHAGP